MELIKRALCPRCLRAARACICDCVCAVPCDIDVLILQHVAEARHIKNSARLLHLCLPSSRLISDAQMDDASLSAILNEQASVLLYPASATMHPAVFSSDDVNLRKKTRLVVIDASWRQSRQMLARYPSLQALPRYALPDALIADYQPRYHIRRAHQEHQLSTLEATALALQQWDSDFQCALLLDAFERFNAQQIAFGVLNLQRGTQD